MRCRYAQVVVVAIAALTGCAVRQHVASRSGARPPAAATQPDDPKAFLSLDQIGPAPRLVPPATQPITRPSLDALELYAKSRDAMTQGQRYTSITLLQKAIELDPASYDLYYELGKAYLSVSNVDDQAMDAMEKAARIEPDHLDLQVQLGRQYLIKGNVARGIEHLRLAMQTTEYSSDDGQAAVADFFLARALKEGGYDRAALDEYAVLLSRFRSPSLTMRQNPELAFLISRPELLYVQIGELYEKHADYQNALNAYEPAADHDAANVDLQSRVARMLASLGRRDDALAKAADLVVKERATPDSLALLRDVCNRLHEPGGEIAAMSKLHTERPEDRAVLSALADALIARNDLIGAERLLDDAWEKSPGDFQLARRLFVLERQRDAVDAAARVLVITLARNPDVLRNTTSLWNELLRPGQKNRMRLSTLQAMRFAPDVESSRTFWVSRIADILHRDVLSRSALQQSSRFSPPFAPAYQALEADIWQQTGLSVEQKISATERLAAQARAGGNAALAMQIRGLSLLNQNKKSEAVRAFADAIELGDHSPDVLLAYAVAGRKVGKDADFERTMWKLISDHPLYEDGYATLFQYYADPDAGTLEQAMKVLSTWLTSDPQSISARLVEASISLQLNQAARAERDLTQLFAEDPDNPQVLENMQSFYRQTGRLDEFITRLEDYRVKHPQDTDVVAKLVRLYADQKRVAEATRVLDATRAAASDDADLLYEVSRLYARFDQRPTAEEVLQQVMRLDPNHPSAANDLGFSWTDEGRNLPRAESLIRIAVAAEPDNEAFLDSLGWVLYKRGKFDEARGYLEQAVGPAAFPDPVVLDHLGDTLYRLSRSDEANRQWQRSLNGIGEAEPARADLRQLRLQLIQKLKASEGNKPVDVAPVVESASTVQAKK